MIFVIFAKFSGSCFFIQRIFGAVNPANAMFAVYSDNFSFPITSFRYSVSSPVLPSFHRIAGRMTLSSLSNATNPCICPPKLIPATCDLSHSAVSSLIPSIDFSNQSSGFCSDHPGCGKKSGYSFETIFLMSPVSSITRSFTADVPRSTPMYNILYLHNHFLLLITRYKSVVIPTDSLSDILLYSGSVVKTKF